MSDYNMILAALRVYPSYRQITEASSYAKDITLGYVRKIDSNAVVKIDDGDVDVISTCGFKDLDYNAQCIFDSAFADKIEKIQTQA